MTQETKRIEIRYSPKPLTEYKQKIGLKEYGPATSAMLDRTCVWNLAYLSFDYEQHLYHPDPRFLVNVRQTCQVMLDGSESDVAFIEPDNAVWGMLYWPAPKFVAAIENHTILPSLPLFIHYGQKWLETIRLRQHKCCADDPDHEETPIIDVSSARMMLARIFK